MNFKKIKSTEIVYAESGYVSNRSTWIFSADWLQSVKCPANRQLRNRAERSRVETVTAKMRGETVETIGIASIVDVVDLSTFRKTQESGKIMGFKGGDPAKHEVVAMRLGGVCAIDIDFAAALYWDSSVVLYVRTKSDPVVLVKNGAIVGLIAPIRIDSK